MTRIPEPKCPTPQCAKNVEDYGERYHRVYDLTYDKPPKGLPNAVAKCESCGGYSDGETWLHACKKCGTTVEPGALRGLFVPHLCTDCDAAIVAEEKARGAPCRMCGSVRSYCCC